MVCKWKGNKCFIQITQEKWEKNWNSWMFLFKCVSAWLKLWHLKRFTFWTMKQKAFGFQLVINPYHFFPGLSSSGRVCILEGGPNLSFILSNCSCNWVYMSIPTAVVVSPSPSQEDDITESHLPHLAQGSQV